MCLVEDLNQCGQVYVTVPVPMTSFGAGFTSFSTDLRRLQVEKIAKKELVAAIDS